jgi:hypothetical protein
MFRQDVRQVLIIAITTLTALGIAVQVVILLSILRQIKSTAKKFDMLSKRAKQHASPAFESIRELYTVLQPQLRIAAGNFVECGRTVGEVCVSLKADTQNIRSTFIGIRKNGSGVTTKGSQSRGVWRLKITDLLHWFRSRSRGSSG